MNRSTGGASDCADWVCSGRGLGLTIKAFGFKLVYSVTNYDSCKIKPMTNLLDNISLTKVALGA